MKKLLPIILGLLATACASSQPAPQQTLYPSEFYKTDKGKWVELDLIYHGCVAISYNGFDIQIDPVAGRGDNSYDYSVFPKPEMIMESPRPVEQEIIQPAQIVAGDHKQFLARRGAVEHGKQRGLGIFFAVVHQFIYFIFKIFIFKQF